MPELNYLHPFKGKVEMRSKDFFVKQEGVAQDGTRIKHFTSRNPANHNDFKQGLLVERKRGRPQFIFGSPQKITQIAAQIKENIDAVAASVRSVGHSKRGIYTLAPTKATSTKEMPSPQAAQNYADAQRLYPNHDRKYNALTDKPTEEKNAFRQHLRDSGIEPAPIGQVVPNQGTLVSDPSPVEPV